MDMREVLNLASNQDIKFFAEVERLKLTAKKAFEKWDVDAVGQFRNAIESTSKLVIDSQQPFLLKVVFSCFKLFSATRNEFSLNQRQACVDLFRQIFEKITIKHVNIFFNFYGLLLFELVGKERKTSDISEEYKLSIMECVTSLARSVDEAIIQEIYTKTYAPRLSEMIVAALNLARDEKYKLLKISAINCVMALSQVIDDDKFEDVVLMDQVADAFVYFLPGIVTQLKTVALSDEKCGHKIPMVALRAWARIVVMVIQDYRSKDQRTYFEEKTKGAIEPNHPRLKNSDDIKEYMETKGRNPQMYINTDAKLKPILQQLSKLAYHSHPKVRKELAIMSILLVEKCLYTAPKSVCECVRILIALSDDTDGETVSLSKNELDQLTRTLQTDEMQRLLEYLEDDFYRTIRSLPRKFNGIDEREKLSALSLLIGYINLFGEFKLREVLQSQELVNTLILTLLYICEFDKKGISVLEEYAIKDFKEQISAITWKKFSYISAKEADKISVICNQLNKHGAGRMIIDFLLDTYQDNSEYKKEAIYLLNFMVQGLEDNPDNANLFKTILFTYIDNWNLPLSVTIDGDGPKHSLGEIQNNIIEACLLCDGIGSITKVTKLKNFMINVYLVVERAGSGHPLIRLAGTQALAKMAQASGCESIEHLINNNMNYISFNLERKLKKIDQSEEALSVLSVILQYSSMEGLDLKASIIEKLLNQISEARQNEFILNSYLKVFKIFIQCLHKWLYIEVEEPPIKSRKEKEEAIEDFAVSGLNDNLNKFSDEDVMGGKTAEECYKEEMEKSQKECENESLGEDAADYKKPEPPLTVKLAAEILNKTHNFLPSKNKTRKLLVLEILKHGIEILKNWDHELLPLVHKIWLALTDRFVEFDTPLIINFSCQLLAVLCRLSKDFIRNRTVKNVLPNVIKVLVDLSKKSYLKDRGAAYRYTQDYKLQVVILEKLARIVTDLDVSQNDIDKVLECVFVYLSNKQPKPLQESALRCCSDLFKYDPEPVKNKLMSLASKYDDTSSEYTKNWLELLKLMCGEDEVAN